MAETVFDKTEVNVGPSNHQVNLRVVGELQDNGTIVWTLYTVSSRVFVDYGGNVNVGACYSNLQVDEQVSETMISSIAVSGSGYGQRYWGGYAGAGVTSNTVSITTSGNVDAHTVKVTCNEDTRTMQEASVTPTPDPDPDPEPDPDPDPDPEPTPEPAPVIVPTRKIKHIYTKVKHRWRRVI